ncbi:MAG: hypothetical protein KBS70_04005 [Bacteroidales bacterium]|nr:hypothetical protein [Candidatus Colicola equi]
MRTNLFNRTLCIVHCALCIVLCTSVHAATTVIPHPFTVGIDEEYQPYVIYVSAQKIGEDTWKNTYADGQRLLTKDEWDYLLNTRSINSIAASSFRGWAQLIDDNNVTKAYAVLLPDDWANKYYFEGDAWYTDELKSQRFFNIGSTFDSNTLNTADTTALQQAGAVFLPCDITNPEGVYANGQYWTGTKEEGLGIYFVQFSTSATNPEEQAISIVDGGEESDKRYVLLAQQEVSITINENVNNVELLQPWATHHKPVNVRLIRSFTPGMYNTLCLPFALTEQEIQTAFGAGTQVARFTGGSLSADKKTLEITFENCTSVEAGLPYIIEPSLQVTDPTFAKRVIEQTTAAGENFSPAGTIAYLGIINPHKLAAGNTKYLFLQANNTLTWSKAGDTSTMKGMRGYFYVPGMQDMPASCPARLSVRPAAHTPTDLPSSSTSSSSLEKFLLHGQLVIIKDNKMYNAQGIQL